MDTDPKAKTFHIFFLLHMGNVSDTEFISFGVTNFISSVLKACYQPLSPVHLDIVECLDQLSTSELCCLGIC